MNRNKSDLIRSQPSITSSSASPTSTTSNSSNSSANSTDDVESKDFSGPRHQHRKLIPQQNDALDAFAALERRVQEFQPSVPTSSNTALVDDDDHDQINNNGDDDDDDDDGDNGNAATQSHQPNRSTRSGGMSRASAVTFRIPSDSNTTFFKPHDHHIIATDESDEHSVMVLGAGDDDDFIVHDDVESRTPSAVALALEHHERKSRGTKGISGSLAKSASSIPLSSSSSSSPTSSGGDKKNLSNSSKNCCSEARKEQSWIQRKIGELLPKGGLLSSAASISAATLGSSAVVIAYCFQRAAIVPGALTLVLNAGFTVYTIWLLMRMLDRLGEESYEGIATRLCGRTFGKSAALCVAFFGWGCAAVYAAVLKSVLAPFVPMMMVMVASHTDDGYNDKASFLGSLPLSTKEKLFPAVVGLVTQVPLALKEEMNSLRLFSTIGTISIIILVVSVTHHATVGDPTIASHRISTRLLLPTSAAEFFATMGIFVFSYCCQTNTFPVYEEMRERSAYRMCLASLLALSVCTAFYIVVGVSGLAAFGPSVSDNIVENFIADGAGNVDTVLCCISVGITVLGCFPVSLLPAREAILEAFGFDRDRNARLVLGIFLAVTALLVGIASPGLVTICSVVGGAIGTWISYVLPVYLTYRHGELLNPSSPHFGRLHVVLCFFVIIFGAGAGSLGSVLAVVRALQG